MPELKNLFIKGKMNKDLDERLIPKGEYRDALNIDVAYSEGADVGVLQNILSNEEVSGMNLVGGTCVGVVKDTEHDKIYWLVAGTNRNGIFEYDGTNIKAILLEEVSDNILQFDPSRYITGINILDKILYFTDNYSEPKQVDTEYWGDSGRFGSVTDFENDTISTFNLSEDRITVAKKAPLNAPTFHTLSASTRGGVGTLGNLTDIETTSIPNLNDTDVDDSISITFSVTPNYETGDIIILKRNITVGQSTESSSARVKITNDASEPTYTVTLLAKTDNVEDTANVSYIPLLEEEEPLFELKFPRFSYRYKYRNNQYSTFAPFSVPAFLPGDFEYDAKNAYNLGMENTVRSLKLQGWGDEFEATPSGDPLVVSPASDSYEADIEEIEILYKDSVSANIYVVDSIKKSGGNFAATFEVKDEQIFKTIESNQLLRAYDSVPKKALGQEIVANRLIYSNITENFDYTDTPSFTIDTIPRTDSVEIAQKLGLKTRRTYQFGIIFQDEYGRQTPVFSNTSGVKKLSQENSDFNLQFKVATSTTPPSEATHYKYYIKETSNEYYNFCIENLYDDKEGSLYLSIPSAEVNKIQEDDFIILKKENGNVAYKNTPNKFKVIAKLNNPPDFLAKKKTVTYSANVFLFDREFAEDDTMDRKVPGITPVEGHNTIYIQDAGASGETNVNVQITDNFKAEFTVGTETRFRRNGDGTESDIYKIASIQYTTNGGAEMTFDKAFGDDVNALYATNEEVPAIRASEIILEKIKIEDDSGSAEFAGKFFVKLNNSPAFKQALENALDESLLYTISTKAVNTTTFANDDRGYYIVNRASANSQLGSFSHNGVTVAAGFHILLRTQEDWADSHSFYNSDPFTKGFKIGNYFRISGGNQRRNDGTDDFDAMYENSTQVNGAVTKSKTIVVDNATGIEVGDKVTTGRMNGTNYSTGGFTQNDFITVEAINGTTITLSAPQTIADNTYIRFIRPIDKHPNYRIEEVIFIPPGSGGNKAFWALKFNKDFDVTFNISNTERYYNLESRAFLAENLKATTNPPIFEVEPKEGPLEIYYETEKTYPIADLSTPQEIPWANCISFGNGVESDRIRDDYNTPTIGKGVRVSTVLEENYQEDNLKNRLIFSGIYNSKNGVNRLNQFIIAEPITKDLNPEYGSIQKLHARDTDLIALCEDRVVKILANKDALFNADGNPQLTATNRVLGQAIIPATFGAYGISKNPESFVDFTYRAYFTDKNRGKVLRLSMDGLTEISEYGMKDYFKDNLAAETRLILGTYDTNKGLYNLTFENEADTVSFSEGVRGWTSRKSFIPEAGVSLNNMYYTFKNGKLYKHYNNSDNRNTFYGAKTDSKVTFYLNGNPGNAKNFRTLNYQGDSGWTSSNIATDKQTGNVSSFIEKEGIYYNYISGEAQTTKTDLDLKALNVQGLGTPTSISVNDATFTELPSLLQPGDKVFNNSNDNIRTVQSISGNTITLDAAPTNAFSYFVKDNKFNTSGVLGYYAEITMTNTSTGKKELYSVGSEVSLSS